MGPIGCPETSVRNYHRSLLNNAEERGSKLMQVGAIRSNPVKREDHINVSNI